MNTFLPLSELKIGQWGIIDRFLEGAASGIRVRLQELGLTPGTLIQLMRFAPCGGPIQLRVGEAFLALRKGEACLLQVRLA